MDKLKIELAHPVSIDGTKVSVLQLRRPKVRDISIRVIQKVPNRYGWPESLKRNEHHAGLRQKILIGLLQL
jgi:hypothetical protein